MIVVKNIFEAWDDGEIDVIAHGCNCFCVQRAGIARAMSDKFDTNNPELFKLEQEIDRSKLEKIEGVEMEPGRWVYNMYTQFKPGPNATFEYIQTCLDRLVLAHPGKRIGIPVIGGGIGGLNPLKVLTLFGNTPNLTIYVHET